MEARHVLASGWIAIVTIVVIASCGAHNQAVDSTDHPPTPAGPPSNQLTRLREFSASTTERVQAALAAGADPNAPFEGEPLTFLAVSIGDLDALQRVIAAGGRLSWDESLPGASFNLVDAAARTSPEVMAFAWTRGLGLASVGFNGEPLGHLVARDGRPETLRWLLDHGLKLEGRNRNGYTLLHAAVSSLAVENVELLLSRKAIATQRDNGGYDAVMLALSHVEGDEQERDRTRIVRLLRAAGDIGWAGGSMPPGVAPAGKDQRDVTRAITEALPFIDPSLRFFVVYPRPPEPPPSASPSETIVIDSFGPPPPQVTVEMYAVRPDQTVILLDGPAAFHKLNLRLRGPADAVNLVQAFSEPSRLTGVGWFTPAWSKLPLFGLPWSGGNKCWKVTDPVPLVGNATEPVVSRTATGFVVKRWVLLDEDTQRYGGNITALGRVTDTVTFDGRWSYTLVRVPSPGLSLERVCFSL